jgi:hypothetical protein
MADAAEKIVEDRIPFIRRFERPDIDRHAEWLFPRMMQVFPHLHENRNVQTFILNALPNNEMIFLVQDNAVALAQVSRIGISPEPVIEEIFVWCKDRADVDQQRDASWFYVQFAEMAKRKQIATVLVDVNTDVPRTMIANVTGRRVFDTKQSYLRMK